MSAISDLYAPVKITGKNIDPKYFTDNGDGTYSFTPLFIRNVARDIVKYTKNRIFELDTNLEYHYRSYQMVKDVWAETIHDEEYLAKYRTQLKEAYKQWNEYRDAHPEEFETRGRRVDIGGSDEAKFFAAYKPVMYLDLKETIELYNEARALLKRFDGPDPKTGKVGPEYESLPFETPTYSKAEYIKKHKGVKKRIYTALGIPSDHFVVEKVERLVCSISNKKCDTIKADDDNIPMFVNGLIDHLTSMTTDEFIADREKIFAKIDSEFMKTFNNAAIKCCGKHSKGAASSMKIRKANPDEPYVFEFTAAVNDESLQYSKTVYAKVDLLRSLDSVKDWLTNSRSKTFHDFIADIDRMIDVLM